MIKQNSLPRQKSLFPWLRIEVGGSPQGSSGLLPAARPPAPPAAAPRRAAGLRVGSLLGMLCFLSALPAQATRGGEPSYPRVMAHTYNTDQLPLDQQEQVPWFDMLSTRESPERLAEIRAANPDIRIYYRSMPQFLPAWNEQETFWHADTSWCLLRLCQYYALQNDWFLYDTSGERIPGWTGYVANWTRHCPLGTYGTSVGMTYAEWYTDVALAQITQNSPEWEPWGWGSSSYDGMAWEVLVDCPHCCVAGQYSEADPDRDGIAEGIGETTWCWAGGDQEPLSILFRETNDAFRERLFDVVSDDLVILINRGGPGSNPSWTTELNGFKLEEWHPNPNPTGSHNWWNLMYGRFNWGAPVGYGYEYAERAMNPQGIDERSGWDVTYLEVMTRRPEYQDPDYRARMIRWGLGTTMLGDGYFTFTEDEKHILWLPEYDWDFGQPVEDFQREVFSGDTLYVRRFEHGQVEVNPYGLYLSGVPPRDSRFSFWLTIEDLEAQIAAPDSVRLHWVQPVTEQGSGYYSQVRQATFPITPENWQSCEPVQGELEWPAVVGGVMRQGAGGLEPNTQYYFAAKNQVHGRYEPDISNVVTLTTPVQEEEDNEAPAAIEDLGARDVTTVSLTLTWTAPGDDAHEGTADHYLVRRRTGGPIETEAQWNSAAPVTNGLPTPGPAGSDQELDLEGLEPETLYGFAVRAVDEAGNIGGLSNPLAVTMLSVPPGAIDDLLVAGVHTDGFDLAWTASGGSAEQGRAASYVLGVLAGQAIDSEADWSSAELLTDGLPVPEVSGTEQSYRLADLQAASTYGLCLRAYDGFGNLSPLGNSPVATTQAPPDTIPPGRIEDLTAEPGLHRVDLAWTAVGDDGSIGTAASYQLGWILGRPIESEEDWRLAQRSGFDLPDPAPAGTPQTLAVEGLEAATTYGFCLRAVDEAMNISPLSPPQTVTTLDPPEPGDSEPPAPIDDLVSSALVDGFFLEWTATGDDGTLGVAAQYELGFLEGGPIETEDDWSAATVITAGLPAPLAPGTPQSYRLNGLPDSTVFGLSLRALDEAGHRSALGRAHVDTTLALPAGNGPDSDPPMMIEDLTVVVVYDDGFLLQWTSPGDDGPQGCATFYVLGILAGSAILTEADWQAALLRSSELPEPTPAGGTQWVRIQRLAAGQPYGLTLRAYDEAGNLSPLGPPLIATTAPVDPDPGEDTIPPAPIDDLLAVEEYPDGFVLTWSAPGDDGDVGIAAAYALGILEGRAIALETDWDAAEKLTDGLPPAGPAGLDQAYRVRGLAPETVYGLALRARDEAGNWGALGTPLQAITLPEEGPDPGGEQDQTPPGAILDLVLEEIGPDWAALRWVCSGADDSSGVAASFVLGLREGDSFSSEAHWQAAAKITAGLPVPGEPGSSVQHRLDGLTPEATVTLMVRAVDDVGQISPLGSALTITPPAPVDQTPPGPVVDLHAAVAQDQAVRLTWTSAGDDGAEGMAAVYTLAVSSDGAIENEAAYQAAARSEHPVETAGGTAMDLLLTGLPVGPTLGFAIRYRDEAGLEGVLSNSPTVVLEEPDPDPDPDVTAPSPVSDLRVSELGVDFLTLTWTASGDDSTSGTAHRYLLAVRSDEEVGPENWESSGVAELALQPQPAGSVESWILDGLDAGGLYGVALRVADEAGNLSPISNALHVRLSTPHIPAPPAPVGDLSLAALGPGWLDLEWTAPVSHEVAGPVARYELCFARVPITEENWPNLLRAQDLPPPGEPGAVESYRLGPIRCAESYWVAVRSRDALGNWSAMSNIVFGMTLAEDRSAPPAPAMPAVSIVRGKEDQGVWVTWLAVEVEDIAGYHMYGRPASATEPVRLCAQRIEHGPQNQIAPGRMGWPIQPPPGHEQYLVCVTAVDQAGNESPASDEVELFAEQVALRGPFPHPIVVAPGGTPAEFHLALPAVSAGTVEVDLRIYSVSGELVRSRWGQGYPNFPAGVTAAVTWDTTNDRGQRVAPGLYFVRMSALGKNEVRKVYVKRE